MDDITRHPSVRWIGAADLVEEADARVLGGDGLLARYDLGR